MPRYIYALIIVILASCARQEPPGRNYLDELRSVNKLVLAQMTISKMATVGDLRPEDAKGMKQTAAALLDQFKFGNRKAAYSYDTYLRSYIDLSQLQPGDISIDHEARTVTIALPPVETEYMGRDVTIREDHYRVTGLRSDIDQDERARIKEAMNASLKAEVEANPEFRQKLEQQARAKARAYFTSIAAADGYKANIIFKPSRGGGQ